MNDFDLVCFTETKLDDFDDISNDDFVFECKNRKRYKNKSGGIALGYRKYLKDFVKVINTDSPYVLWLSLDKKVLQTDHNVIFGIIYIPPEGSIYATVDAFSEVELEFQNINRTYEFVCLLGDMNARTGNLCDFIEQAVIDDFFTENILDINEFNEAIVLKEMGLNMKRNNPDIVVNSYGRKYIEFCRNNNVFIFNGRVGKDSVGNPTCKNSSVVDYICSTGKFLCLVQNFEVMEFSSLLSDVHSPLALSLKSNKFSEETREKNVAPKSRIRRWDPDKRQEFEGNLDPIRIQSLYTYMLNAVDNDELVDKESVDHFTQEVTSIIIDAAEHTFGVSDFRKNSRFRESRELWFNTDCRKSRKDFRRAKRLYKKYGSCLFRTRLKMAETHYKKVMDENIARFNREMQAKMKHLRLNKPKDFWKIFRRRSGRESTNIPLDDLFEFFKELNRNKTDSQHDYIIDNDIDIENNMILNDIITKDEICKAVQSAKNNKSSGDDGVINEYIAASFNVLSDILVLLFNLIFDTGHVPEAWLTGIVIPIYKNKGDKLDPKNYRPVTLLSCLGKIFTSILNTRMNKFIEDLSLLHENQAGFRSGYATTDHIFSLYALFELISMRRKKLHCAFIDFEKAFDSIHRNSLFYKLIGNSISGKFLCIIQNMYDNVKSYIRHNNECSDIFKCEIGVRQGENLSPVLFSLYLNDLQSYLESCNVKGLESIERDIENELMMYVKILLLLYADDSILLSESGADLQLMLNNFSDYCEIWKLKINVGKTKILIFGKGRQRDDEKFYLNGEELEKVTSYKYLGVFFARSGSFLTTRKFLKEQAIKAMYSLIQNCRRNNISIECQLEMFDRAILPILLYGSEIWGFENIDLLEQVHLRFCKTIPRLKLSTPNIIIYGELGRFPLSLAVKIRMVKFWCRLEGREDNKFSSILYKLLYINFANYGFNSKWIVFMKNIFDSCGMSNVWTSPNQFNPEWIAKSVELRLKDQFKQDWFSEISNSSKCYCYKIFKTELCFENYFSILPPYFMHLLCRFRCGSHRLPVETGRWRNTPRNERLCTLCESHDIGDEFHYIFECNFFNEERRKFLSNHFHTRVNVLKYNQLFNSKDVIVLTNLAKFVKIIMSKVVPPG